MLRSQTAEKIPSVKFPGDSFFHVVQALRDRHSVLRDHYTTVKADLDALHNLPCVARFRTEKVKVLQCWEIAGVR